MKDSVTDYELAAIGYVLYDKVYDIYVQCDAEDDFCVNHVDFNADYNVGFGRENTVMWSPIAGLYVNSSWCTKEFMDKFNSYMERQEGIKS